MKSRLVMRLAGFGFASVIVGIVAMVGLFAYFAKDLPSPEKIVRREGFATKIYDRNGKLLYDVFADQRRTPVDITAVPLVMQQATVAIEDKNFYKHQGFDVLGLFRAVVIRPLLTGRFEGGSTVTQQLVKNTLLTSQRTITRKIKEFILTVQVERKYTKPQILQMYLNEAPYGGTAWGVEAAAQTYFGKSTAELSLVEAAILAGLPQSPTRYSPFAGKAYMGRAAEVLRRMREDGYITRGQELEAKTGVEKMEFATAAGLLKAPHFVFYVKQKLIERYGENVVEQGGLRVTTTIDLDLQEASQKAVTEEVEKVKYLKVGNGAAVTVDSVTGQILAMVGSKGWEDPNYDGKFNVATAARQPGSSIKPVVYLTGLRKGYTAATILMDTKTSFPGGDKPEYAPENYDGKFRGPILMREALGNSINVPAVKMLAMVGVSEMMEVAADLGLTTLAPTPETLKRVGLSLALGGGEVRPIEMATAYSAFANGGKKVEPVAILKVTDKDGRILEEWKDQAKKQVMSAEEAFVISSILSDPKARDITFGPRSLVNIAGRTVAVKTGTTNDRRDNWTAGWTANGPVVVVWVGNNDNSAMKEVASGVTGAAPIWRRIILAALAKSGDRQFDQPGGIVSMDVDRVSGYPAHDGFEAKQEFFIRGTEPVGPDPIHRKIRDCDGQDKEYYFFKEEDPFIADDKTNKWQEGILNWLKDQADAKYHPPTDGACQRLEVTFQEPADKGQVDSNDVSIKLSITSVGAIRKVEISVDGSVKETMSGAPWDVVINMSNGSHRIEVRAEDDRGNVGTRYVEIGVNQPWAEPSPTPTPTP